MEKLDSKSKEWRAMSPRSNLVALTAFLVAMQIEAAPTAYEFVTGPVNSAPAPGVPGFAPDSTVSGTFTYDSAVPLTGSGTLPGTVLFAGALGELLGTVQGMAFSDPSGTAVVGNEQTGTPPGTSGADLVTLAADIRGICEPCDLQGFALGDYQLVNVRLFWLEGALGAPDFLPTSDLPAVLPEFAGRLALDFVSTTGAGPTLFVFFDNLLVRPVGPPDPGLLLQELGEAVEGVGPGKSLAAKVANAETYYAVPDAQATCAVLSAFMNEVKAQAGKKTLTDTQAAALVSDAQTIMVSIGCD